MYATTQSKIEHVQHETALLRDSRQTVPKRTPTLVTAVFMEQHGVGRLEELAETLDFPLDFQI